MKQALALVAVLFALMGQSGGLIVGNTAPTPRSSYPPGIGVAGYEPMYDEGIAVEPARPDYGPWESESTSGPLCLQRYRSKKDARAFYAVLIECSRRGAPTAAQK